MRKHRIGGLLALALVLAGCGGGGDGGGGAGGEVAGDITVLTNRTDIVDTVFEDYATTFEARYPEVNVEFEAITNYEDDVKIRLNTKDYGDVLLVPGTVTPDQLPNFFESLGATDELAKKYRFVTEKAYEGQTYGLATFGNANGFVYNKKVWQAAGVTAPPATPAAFLDALRKIKDSSKAVPLYTNYAAGWPMTGWEGNRGGASGDPEATNTLGTLDAPWAAGEEHFVIDSLLYDAVAAGLTEPDPTTTEWELSKEQLGRGEIATMMLGSWAITQMKEKAANPDDIGYLPFPNQVDGAFHSVVNGDYSNAVNKNSDSKAAARAWVDWFANESGYAQTAGGISPLIDGPLPETLADFETAKVETFELTPEQEKGLVEKIDKAAEIGLQAPDYRQRLIDAARGAKKETKESIFADLNAKWAASRAETAAG